MGELRYDLGGLESPTRMPNGWLRVDGYLTKVGVFRYVNADGTERLELRSDDEVNKSLTSFGMVPVTDDHPDVGVLDATNTAKYQRGTVSEAVRRDGDAIRASMLITDGALADKMRAGKCGLSCGYEVDLDRTSGNHPVYGRYDAIQRNIRGNHVAVVTAGRAGPIARARMDAAVQVRSDMIQKRGEKWCVYSADGSKKLGEYDTEEEAKKRLAQVEAHKDAPTKKSSYEDSADDQAPAEQALPRTIGVAMNEEMKAALADAAAQKARADALETELAAEKSRADAGEGACDALKAQLAEAMTAIRTDGPAVSDLENQVKVLTLQVGALKDDLNVANDPTRRRTDVRARVKLEAAGAAILGPKFNADSMDDKEILHFVLEKLHGPVPKDRSEEYLRARFDAAVEGYFASEAALARAKDVIRNDEARRADSRTAHDRMVQYNRSTREEK